MNELPTFSIVTAVRNAAGTIGQAIESVNAQTHAPAQHIVVDALSTDSTLATVKNYRRAWTSIVSEADTGIYDAFNKGVQRAQGDVISFLNADDYYATPHVLRIVASAFAESGVDAVFGDVQFIRPSSDARVVRAFRSASFSVRRLAMGFMPAHPALFVRRSVFQRVGLFNTSYQIAGDFEFVVRAFAGEQIGFLHIPKVFVTMRTGGVSTRGLRSTVMISREILRACRENGIRTNRVLVYGRLVLKVREFLPMWRG